MAQRLALVLALFALKCLAGDVDNPAPSVLNLASEMKQLLREFKIEPTKNFQHSSTKPFAEYRCYYTGKFELPESYMELKLKEGTEQGCNVDQQTYDVFFYPIEAVAAGDTPVTKSLEEAPLERVLFVIPHEEFHDVKPIKKYPVHFREATSTLMGFLAAIEFAWRKFGPSAPVTRNLQSDAELFYRKSLLVNEAFNRLRDLYDDFHKGVASENHVLQQKADIFAELARQCSSLQPQASSFNACPGALNNAGLSFDYTYTKLFPLVFEAIDARQTSPADAIRRLQELLQEAPEKQELLIQYLQARRASKPVAGLVSIAN